MLYISGMYAVLFMYEIVPKDQYTKCTKKNMLTNNNKTAAFKTNSRPPALPECAAVLSEIQDIRNARARDDLCVGKRYTHARRFYHEHAHTGSRSLVCSIVMRARASARAPICTSMQLSSAGAFWLHNTAAATAAICCSYVCMPFIVLLFVYVFVLYCWCCLIWYMWSYSWNVRLYN